MIEYDVESMEVKVISPVNIAIIKYWGKKDEEEIIPTNPSLSVTLSTEHMYVETVLTTQIHGDNILLINGKREEVTKRIMSCINEAKKYASYLFAHNKEYNNLLVPSLDSNFIIDSRCTFPISSGLASSAAGLSAIAYGLIKIFRLEKFFSLEVLSSIAKKGSGSSCRSLLGGFVEWNEELGGSEYGFKKIINQVGLRSNNRCLTDLRILVLQVGSTKKLVSSAVGMKLSTITSELHKYRVENVTRRLNNTKSSIENEDMPSLFKHIMTDSNQLHAICLDTFPPVFYLNETSIQVIRFVHYYNEYIAKRTEAAYSFDAGPHPFLFIEKQNLQRFLVIFQMYFPVPEKNIFHSEDIDPFSYLLKETEKECLETSTNDFKRMRSHNITKIYCCKVGDGPKIR